VYLIRPCLLGALIVAVSAAAQAHHSIAGMYDGSRRVTVDGVVAEFHYVNPHPFVLLDAKEESGRMQRWKLELDNRRELAAIGITTDTWRSGDRLVASGSPGRDDQRALYTWRLERPADGLLYEQIGMSPRIRGLRR
jgi:hypothetical protein